MAGEKEHADYLVDLGKKLAEPLERDYDGRKYINKDLKPMEPPLRAALKISTLGSLIELYRENFEGLGEAKNAHVIHVVDETEVQAISHNSNEWAKREVLIICKLDLNNGFKFGQFMSHEEFTVGVLANFTQTDHKDYILRIASSITAERVVTSDDDGISQGVGLRSGVSLKTQETLQPRVKLAPYRTFREVAQPASEFIFRVKQDGDSMPKLALYEADGGAWKLEARDNIARLLSAGIPKAVVAN